ncbi:rhomboid family intramembrane serine protease [Alicyclobacillus dauci]|uniref:Rhomboid family intramembrane serine protease n=1 Tax=Alicyclobacillus dauci TaxID=1475485 RepID=A0ABY6Z6B0_9BACL|nr:rhomboid family intramembrane serine protease [Alicyclobacillus dauci]WAH38203.1 rhomboid family intramembrane serine protease [Alicyclobacillus dauci]
MHGFRTLLGRRQFPGRWPASFVLMALSVFWFVIVETIFGHSTQGLVRSGALAGLLVSHGQWFRLLSSLFVHVTFVHLFVNMISLWSLVLVENLVGTNVFLVIYLVSGILGNAVSLVFTPGNVISAGASGAIFGLFGAMLTLAMLKILPVVVRNQLFILLAINVVLDITHSEIDWLAHLGGMIAGVLLTLLYVRAVKRPKFWRIWAWTVGVLAGFSLVLTLFTRIP